MAEQGRTPPVSELLVMIVCRKHARITRFYMVFVLWALEWVRQEEGYPYVACGLAP